MPISNKDGTPYRLRGVNPLMVNQEHWQAIKVNLELEEFVLPDPRITAEEEAIVGGGSLQQTDLVGCLPALTMAEEEDPLYGFKTFKPGWGEKFTFEALKTQSTGLTAVFLANVPKDKISEGSILFVYNDREWWKVSRVEEGTHIHCVPSDIKPSF